MVRRDRTECFNAVLADSNTLTRMRLQHRKIPAGAPYSTCAKLQATW